MIDVAYDLHLDRDLASRGQLPRFVMIKNGLIDLLFLCGGQCRLKGILAEDLLGKIAAEDRMPGLWVDRFAGQAEPLHAKAVGDLDLTHLAPSRIMQDKSDLDDALIDHLL